MRRGEPLAIVAFGAAGDPLVELDLRRDIAQAKYLRCYLHDLGARSVVIEPHYFDRDYLAEFVAFYATSTAGYPNVCRRMHVFSTEVTREVLVAATGGDPTACAALQHSYLGHIVLRPLPDAPIGRTVLRLYPDHQGLAAGTPRIMSPARSYDAHVAGLTWRVQGLAWQQQDSAVGACATIAIWSMLHASAFDDHHAIPTTAEITVAAQRGLPTGSRVFPAADGLSIEQMLEVIKHQGLAPVVIDADDKDGFSSDRFCTLVGAFLRSGYPVLVNGFVDEQDRAGHAVCLVGFRSPPLPSVPNGCVQHADSNIEFVYVHDDNIGPNVRTRVARREIEGREVAYLEVEAPTPTHGELPTTDPTVGRAAFVPTEIIVAVHPELRTAPSELRRVATRSTGWLAQALDLETAEQHKFGNTGLILSSRFIPWVDYVDGELGRTLADAPDALARARLALWEVVPPMSLHVGLVRASLGMKPLVDVLFDTSDNDRHLRPTAHLAFHTQVPWLRRRWEARTGELLELGVEVPAWP